MPAKKTARSRKPAKSVSIDSDSIPTHPTEVFSAIAVWSLQMATWASKVEDSYMAGRENPTAALELMGLGEGFTLWATGVKAWADDVEQCYLESLRSQSLFGHDRPPPPPFKPWGGLTNIARDFSGPRI